MADIVIYGGGLQACAAATKAAANAPNKSILLIVPDPIDKLGSLGTIGGQNYFDKRDWKNPYTGITIQPQQGSFAEWNSQVGDFYNTDALACQLYSDVIKHTNVVDIKFKYDIENLQYATNPYRITALNIRNVYRDTKDGYVKFGSRHETVSGTVFIDASEEGRLLRLFNPSAVTVGRYDWPSNLLDTDECTGNKVARQQVATLMVKMTGIQPPPTGTTYGDMVFEKSQKIVNGQTQITWGCYGGWGAYAGQNGKHKIVDFNNKYGLQDPSNPSRPHGYAIKPLNAAQNGSGASDWWVNTFLVFNVDGRAYYRDRNTSRYPSNKRTDYKDVDQAWADARNFLKNNATEFINAIKEMDGFANADFVYGSNGHPVIGDILYLRETIHAMNASRNTSNGTENSNYQFTTAECSNAGDSSDNGADASNYSSRIGLGFYQTDINAYKFEDLKDSSGNYIWGVDVQSRLRPDIGITPDTPYNPVYIPYASLVSKYVANVLIPGYTSGCSSMAWSEMRVLPNLCVFGDAAGIAAAYCANNNKYPLTLTSTDISNIQNTLVNAAEAKLEKA